MPLLEEFRQTSQDLYRNPCQIELSPGRLSQFFKKWRGGFLGKLFWKLWCTAPRKHEKTKLKHATFGRIKTNVPRFVRNSFQFERFPGRLSEFIENWRLKNSLMVHFLYAKNLTHAKWRLKAFFHTPLFEEFGQTSQDSWGSD